MDNERQSTKKSLGLRISGLLRSIQKRLVSKVRFVWPVLIQHGLPQRSDQPKQLQQSLTELLQPDGKERLRRWSKLTMTTSLASPGKGLETFGTCHSDGFATRVPLKVNFTAGIGIVREAPGKYKQRLWSKAGGEGHPSQEVLSMYGQKKFTLPKGEKQLNLLWNAEEGKYYIQPRKSVTLRALSEPWPAKKEQKEKKERTWTMKETIDW